MNHPDVSHAAVLLQEGDAADTPGINTPNSSSSSSSDASAAALIRTLQHLSSPEAAPLLQSKRRALERLRYVLNQQAAAKLDGLIAAARDKPRAGSKQA